MNNKIWIIIRCVPYTPRSASNVVRRFIANYHEHWNLCRQNFFNNMYRFIVHLCNSILLCLCEDHVYHSSLQANLKVNDIVSLIVCVFGIIDHKASLTVLFIIIAIFVFVMIVSFPIIDFYEKKCLKKLDEFAPSF